MSNDIQVVSKPYTGVVAARISAIREAMPDRLPVFMVPTIWIVVEGFPMLPSGKLNRAKVEKWVADMGEEEFLAHIEVLDEEVLGCQKVV